MQNRSGRPPIDIREEAPQYDNTGPQPGGLGYSQAPRNFPQPQQGRQSIGNSGGGMSLSSAILGAILGIVGSVLIMFQMGATKADIQTAKGEITQSVATQIAPLQAQVNTIVGNSYVKADTLANYATTASLAGYALKTEVVSGGSYYTKTELDALLLKKADVGTSPGTTPGTTPTGAAPTFSLLPATPNVVSGTAGSSSYFTLRIFNNTGVPYYIKPGFILNTSSGSTPVVVTSVVPTIQYGSSATPVFNISPLSVSTNSLTIISQSGGSYTTLGEYLVSNSANPIDMTIFVNVTSTTPAVWNVIPLCSYRTIQ